MLKKWRPSKRFIGVCITMCTAVLVAFSLGYIIETLKPKVNISQTQRQYDSPKETLDFQLNSEQPKELHVTFSEERSQQNFNKQTSLSFEKKIVDNKENERNFLGLFISIIIIVTLIGGIAAAMYIQWHSAKQSDEIGGM